MKTEEQARDEFEKLLYEDDEFISVWGYCEGSQTKLNEDDIRVLTREQALKEQQNAIFLANNPGNIADFFFPPLSTSIFFIVKNTDNNFEKM